VRSETILRHYPLTSYFVLAYALVWGGVLGVVEGLADSGSSPTPAEVGIMALPMLFAPGLVAIALTALEEGKAGLRAMWARMKRWRVELRWYALAVVALSLLVLAILHTLGALVSPVYAPTLALMGMAGLFADFNQRFPHRDIEADFTRRLFNTTHWPRQRSPFSGRSDLLADSFDELLFEGITFGDPAKGPGRGYLTLSGTDVAAGTRFEFEQEQFEMMCAQHTAPADGWSRPRQGPSVQLRRSALGRIGSGDRGGGPRQAPIESRGWPGHAAPLAFITL
jgi:hypothetical protein